MLPGRVDTVAREFKSRTMECCVTWSKATPVAIGLAEKGWRACHLAYRMLGRWTPVPIPSCDCSVTGLAKLPF